MHLCFRLDNKHKYKASDYICNYLKVGVIKITVNFNLLHFIGKDASRKREKKKGLVEVRCKFDLSLRVIIFS